MKKASPSQSKSPLTVHIDCPNQEVRDFNKFFFDFNDQSNDSINSKTKTKIYQQYATTIQMPVQMPNLNADLYDDDQKNNRKKAGAADRQGALRMPLSPRNQSKHSAPPQVSDQPQESAVKRPTQDIEHGSTPGTGRNLQIPDYQISQTSRHGSKRRILLSQMSNSDKRSGERGPENADKKKQKAIAQFKKLQDIMDASGQSRSNRSPPPQLHQRSPS